MSTSLRLEDYSSKWAEEVYARYDNEARIKCKSKSEAYAKRLQAYGYKRALRAAIEDPERAWDTTVGVRQEMVELYKRVCAKECIIRDVGGWWYLIIRPRVDAEWDMEITQADMTKVLPAVQARAAEAEDMREIQEEWERNNPPGQQPRESPEQELQRTAMEEMLKVLNFKRQGEAK